MPAKNKNAWESEMPGTAADRPVTRIASPADRNAYERDGLVVLPKALDADAIARVEAAYNWKLANLGPYAQEVYPDSDTVFIQASGDSGREPAFQALFEETPIPQIAASLLGGGDVWYLNEQLFLKEGGGGAVAGRRTPWHQDSSYMPFGGDGFVVFWIPLDPIPRDCALELVRGSHRGVTYNASTVDPNDDTAPLYLEGDLPRLPDIEAQRDRFDIVGHAMEVGDVLVFHAGMLHGGGGTRAGSRRRSLTLRFVGADVRRIARPKFREDTHVINADIVRREHGDAVEGPYDRYERLEIGTPIYKSGLLKVLSKD